MCLQELQDAGNGTFLKEKIRKHPSQRGMLLPNKFSESVYIIVQFSLFKPFKPVYMTVFTFSGKASLILRNNSIVIFKGVRVI